MFEQIAPLENYCNKIRGLKNEEGIISCHSTESYSTIS